MKNSFKTAIIDDSKAFNIDRDTESNLLDLFDYAMKSVACTQVGGAKSDTTDFATAKQCGCVGFASSMHRTFPDSRLFWTGEFQRGEQRINVMGHLE